MTYLVSPYFRPDAAIRERRFQAACQATAALLRAGHVVFSPIIQSHALVAHGLPTDWAFWQHVGREHLRRCDEVEVLMLEGREESVGAAGGDSTGSTIGETGAVSDRELGLVSARVEKNTDSLAFGGQYIWEAVQ